MVQEAIWLTTLLLQGKMSTGSIHIILNISIVTAIGNSVRQTPKLWAGAHVWSVSADRNSRRNIKILDLPM